MDTVTASGQLPALDSDRLRSTLEGAAQIGRWRPPGVQRLALSDADREMRDGWIASGMTEGLARGYERLDEALDGIA